MNDYTGWNRSLIVTLTATSNPYLRNELPLRGRLLVHEMRTDGYAQPTKMTFVRIDSEGRAGAAFHVDDAEFSYAGPGAMDAL